MRWNGSGFELHNTPFVYLGGTGLEAASALATDDVWTVGGGGDGDWAKESLCFGLMVENGYQGVYRIWSRAWLVTK